MGLLGIIFGQGKSSIGGLVIDATVNQDHVGSAEITKNPVESGAQITDHVQLNPNQLIIEGIISDTPLGFPILQNVLNIVNTVTTLFGQSSRSIDGFNKLVELKDKREPFTVITNLKRYSDMVIAELIVTRSNTTGNAIEFKATIEQIRIVSSQSATLTGNLGGSLDSGVAGSIKDVGAKTQDLGNKVTTALPVTNPVSSVPSSTVSPSKSSAAFKVFTVLGF